MSRLMAKISLGPLLDRVSKILIERAGFLSDNLYDFDPNSNSGKGLKTAIETNRRKWLLVVSREHYFETVKDYPIGQLNDLKNVLKNDPWRFPFMGLLLRRIERMGSQSHRVTFWVFRKDTLDSLPQRPLWIVPESACLSQKLLESQERIGSFSRLGKTVFVAVTPDGVVSSLGGRNSFFNQIGESEDCASASELEKSGLNDEKTADAILSGAIELIKVAPLSFFSGLDLSRFNKISWQGFLRASIAACSAYLLCSTLYTMAVGNWLDYRIRSAKAVAESSIAIRQQINISDERLNSIISATENFPPIWVVWDLFLDLKEKGAHFRAVSGNAEKVTFHVNFPKATEFLSILNKDQRLAEANLSGAVRKIGDLEQFAVDIKLEKEPAFWLEPKAPNWDVGVPEDGS